MAVQPDPQAPPAVPMQPVSLTTYRRHVTGVGALAAFVSAGGDNLWHWMVQRSADARFDEWYRALLAHCHFVQ